MINKISSYPINPYAATLFPIEKRNCSTPTKKPEAPIEPQPKPRMCKSDYDLDCCCPDWVIEEFLNDTNIEDPDNEPGLKDLLNRDCVDCYAINEWIEDQAVASHTGKKKPAGFSKSTFDMIMGFGKPRGMGE